MNQSDYSNDNLAIADMQATTTVVEIVKGPAPEIGGREGPEPTRFGDWEKNGRCIDF
jgi:hypothetical protein